MNSTLGVSEKLLKCFNRTIVVVYFVRSFPVTPVIFCLNLKKALLPGKSSIAPPTAKANSCQ